VKYLLLGTKTHGQRRHLSVLCQPKKNGASGKLARVTGWIAYLATRCALLLGRLGLAAVAAAAEATDLADAGVVLGAVLGLGLFSTLPANASVVLGAVTLSDDSASHFAYLAEEFAAIFLTRRVAATLGCFCSRTWSRLAARELLLLCHCSPLFNTHKVNATLSIV
jgi:hypothetical protein